MNRYINNSWITCVLIIPSSEDRAFDINFLEISRFSFSSSEKEHTKIFVSIKKLSLIHFFPGVDPSSFYISKISH